MRLPPFQVMIFLLVAVLLFSLNRMAPDTGPGNDPEIEQIPVSDESVPWPHETVPEGMVKLTGGEFIFGSSSRQKRIGYQLDRQYSESGEPASVEQEWYDAEPAPQTGTTSPFAIDATPVTNAEYQEFVAQYPEAQPGITEEAWEEQELEYSYERVQDFLWEERRPPEGREEHPVVLVDRAAAALYCSWRGERFRMRHPEGPELDFRLPTGAEYERAARGRTGRAFGWGQSFTPGVTNVVHWQGGERKALNDTAPVSEFPEDVTEEGVRHTGGMVSEWTATPWLGEEVWQPGEGYEPNEADAAPEDLFAESGEDGEPGFGELRSRAAEGLADRYEVRGGSFDDLPGMSRATTRHSRPAGLRHILTGFRCVALPQESALQEGSPEEVQTDGGANGAKAPATGESESSSGGPGES